MAQRPDGKPARPERVTFTRPAAERIAKVVRTVEGGDRDAGPLTFGTRAVSSNAKLFRVCTFTGAWAIGTDKVVTFKYTTATPNTASATNLFFPVTSTAAKDCAIAKDGTAWFLIDVPLATASAVFVTGTQLASFASTTATAVSVSATATQSVVTDITLSASLNTSACTITIGKTLVTASQTFVTGTATAVVISSTATAVFVTGTATATYLRLE